MELDPKIYNIHFKTKLAQVSEDTIGIVIDRKSRIIMSDGRKILDKVHSINEVAPSLKVVVITTAPVCSKTRVFLEQSDVPLKQASDLAG